MNTIRVFDDYATLMAEVKDVSGKLALSIRDALDEARRLPGQPTVTLGTLHFAGVEALDLKKAPKTIQVVFMPLWGLMYVREDGRLSPNNNGGIIDLLRNDTPHGLPTEGSWFKAEPRFPIFNEVTK